MTSGGVRVERGGPVTTVIMNRPEARNAVNGPAAAELYEAFDEFDKDDGAAVAVLWGDNGTFCAGADLKAFGTPDANTVHRTGLGIHRPLQSIGHAHVHHRKIGAHQVQFLRHGATGLLQARHGRAQVGNQAAEHA